ncbi:MAG: YbaK/EbsC family protein [Silicimonas sp.]|nr:YbaK/EbsC family protein [Silicimonas sp.]
MSKSLKRVTAALAAAGVAAEVLEMPGETRTATDAAREAGCEIDQIAKSIIFRGESSDSTLLFITAGGNQVDAALASALAGEPLGRADAAFVRERTGFAIGGVAPLAHRVPPLSFFDPRLSQFSSVFAAAGTPRHIFRISPEDLLRLSGAERARFTGQPDHPT